MCVYYFILAADEEKEVMIANVSQRFAFGYAVIRLSGCQTFFFLAVTEASAAGRERPSGRLKATLSAAMESLRELTGLDPHDLVSEEDLVLVRSHEPLPELEPLPSGVSVHRDGVYLRFSRDTLVARHKAGCLDKMGAQVAVFAGCPRFCCSRRFQEAAAERCSRAVTVVLVHNLNALRDLVDLFQAADALYLLHDIVYRLHFGVRNIRIDTNRVHVCSIYFSRMRRLYRPASPVRASLRVLYGDCSSLRLNHLFLGAEAATGLLERCHNLTEVETNMAEQGTTPPKVLGFNLDAGCGRQWRSLVLGCALPTKEVSISADVVLEAAKRWPVLRHLQIVTANEAAVYSAGAFQELRSLSVLFCPVNGSLPKKCRYGAVSAVLSKFSPSALCLRTFTNVSLTGLAASCARLRRLRIVDCDLCDLDLRTDALPELEELEVSYLPPNGLRRLMATCPNLRSLSILDRGASFCFLREASCPKAGRLNKLERLSLMADSIAIDSFEAHLFLADYAPHLELAWSACVAFEVKFPQWNKEHADLWSQVNEGPVE
ncbi:hypothetical protein HPB51_014063 [Rhipicephalus microplus]|uniref:Uncharacterized protein n=1 Tax=Rhipicephalus microplus TaxID=6941 RepID=A0A9J6E9M2_RHIMP|nr:hypothetical protein HPB51_014063 [Rhipicephalus microplus]